MKLTVMRRRARIMMTKGKINSNKKLLKSLFMTLILFKIVARRWEINL